ncbi:unnamed protein product [Adineta steineri]|uniref:Ig-like domain-containing protein n=2 Tax=Adineta steineri TaxID=433720 RepID=A0A818VUR7_9BILA|nr:unnamed protein product [Adineta steineri]
MHIRYSMMLYFLLILIICRVQSEKIEKITKSVGQSFSFDCQQDESVYFTQKLDDWSEIQENDNQYSYLNLNFNYLNQEKILRVSSNSIQSENIGYYGCRKPTWSTASMNRIYQLIVADVQSFYWNYICHGTVGSCLRSDDPIDETLSTFEVADQTKVDFFCCASVLGFKNVDLNMNPIGDIRGKINIHRRQESDGSWVVCANQHTFIKRTSSNNQQILTCELMTDNQLDSSLSSVIRVKDSMPADPDIDPPYGYVPTPKTDDDKYFNKPTSGGKRGKLTTGKRILIILGSILGGLFFFGLLFLLIFFFCRRQNKAPTNSKTNIDTNHYETVNIYEKPDTTKEQNRNEEESHYLEPTPLYQNSPVVFRL